MAGVFFQTIKLLQYRCRQHPQVKMSDSSYAI